MLILIGHGALSSGQDPCINVKQGKVPHPTSCSKYYMCSNYKGAEKVCINSELYSPKAKDCVLKSQSECVITTTPKPTTSTRKTALPPRTAKPSKPCSPNLEHLKLFTYHEFKNKKYYLSKDVYSSDVASAALCETICGYLAEVDNRNEQNYMDSMLHNVSSNLRGLLIAGTDKFVEGVWEFERGRRPVMYLNWGDTEPNNASNEDCMCLLKYSSIVYDCASQLRYWTLAFVCELY